MNANRKADYERHTQRIAAMVTAASTGDDAILKALILEAIADDGTGANCVLALSVFVWQQLQEKAAIQGRDASEVLQEWCQRLSTREWLA